MSDEKSKFWTIKLKKALVVIFIFCFLSALFVWGTYFLVWPSASSIEMKLSTIFSSIQAVAGLATAAAIVGAFAQVKQAKTQLSDNRRWNQMSFAVNFFATHPIEKWEEILEKSFVKVISRDSPLENSDLEKIFADDQEDVRLALKNFLNALEQYCVAINLKLAHEESAKRVYGHKLVAHYFELEPYVMAQRQRLKSSGLFCELENVCKRWKGEFTAAGDTY